MIVNPKLKKFANILAGVTVTLTVLFVIDTVPTLIAGSALREALSKDPGAAGLVADVNAIGKCNEMFTDDGKFQPAWRDCYLTNVPKARSTKGAFVQAMKVRGWLEGHPDDAEVRARAVAAVDAGWAAFKAYEPMYALHDKFEAALNRSVFLRLVYGADQSRGMRKIEADMLEKAELAVVAPDLFTRQVRRQADLAMARDTLSATAH